MKTKLHLLISLLLLAVAFASCSESSNEPDVTYTVTFDADGGTPAPQAQTVQAGEKVAAPANPAKQGYVFLFWHLSGANTAYNFQTSVNSNIALQAKWQAEATAEYWQVTWVLSGGTWATNDDHALQVVKGGTLAEPTAPTKAGKVFDGWYKESELTNKINFPYNVSAITANFTLYAKWSDPAAEYWDITWELNSGAWPATGDNHVAKVEKGSTLVEPAAPTKAGNTFDGWYKEEAFTNKVTFPATVTSDFKLYAKWTDASPTSFTISNTAEWNGAISTIKANGNNKSYTLTIVGNVSVPPTTGVEEGKPNTYTFGGGENLTVTLNGSGTLALSGQGFLICLSGKYLSERTVKQKLIIDGATLQGRTNTVPLLRLDYADLDIKNGKITGNTNSGADGVGAGSGVYIKNGIFNMSAGEISNNICGQTSYGNVGGGGVYLRYSHFNMSGGVISNNTATSGGGVYMNGSALDDYYFTMTGGVIRSNTASITSSYDGAYGGGVYVSSYAKFTKTGGIIYGFDGTGADKNRVVNNAGNALTTNGAAVFAPTNIVINSNSRRRESTLGENDNISSSNSAGWGI